MNTWQLVALWFGGLVIAAIGVIAGLDSGSYSWLIFSVALLTALAIYTLRPHPNAKKRLVFWRVFISVGVLVLGAAALYQVAVSRSGQPSALDRLAPSLNGQAPAPQKIPMPTPIPLGEIEVFDVRWTPGLQVLEGRIRNNSTVVFGTLVLDVDLLDSDEVIDGASLRVLEWVAAGEVRSFSAPLKLRGRPEWRTCPSASCGLRWEVSSAQRSGRIPRGGPHRLDS